MPKKVVKVVKLQVPGGKATPAPPVGPALGQAGINIMAFVKDFNARTAQQAGLLIPVEISVFEDRSFTFITKTPPASVLLLKSSTQRQRLVLSDMRPWKALVITDTWRARFGTPLQLSITFESSTFHATTHYRNAFKLLCRVTNRYCFLQFNFLRSTCRKDKAAPRGKARFGGR